MFLIQSRTNEYYHKIQHTEIGQGTNFHTKQNLLFIFWIKFAQKRYFRSKTEKTNITIKFRIFKLVKKPNFILISSNNFGCLTKFVQKWVFSDQNRKGNILSQRVQHIWTSLKTAEIIKDHLCFWLLLIRCKIKSSFGTDV